MPETKDILRKQRNRWMRGTMETLRKHRNMIFNPKYGKLGMVSLPYWFFFEFLGPLIEFSGVAIFIIFLLLGIINYFSFASFYFGNFLRNSLSVYAIFGRFASKQVYSKPKKTFNTYLTAVLEPLFSSYCSESTKVLVDYFKNLIPGER